MTQLGPYNRPVDYLRRLEPTPTGLRNGRKTLAIFAAFVAVLWALTVFVPGFGDTGTVAIMATTSVALAGDAIAYLGRPTLTRYRWASSLTAVGVAASFILLIARPFASASG